jgi:hypothetical protein
MEGNEGGKRPFSEGGPSSLVRTTRILRGVDMGWRVRSRG